MTERDARRLGAAGWRLAGIGLLAAGVTVALYAAGRLQSSMRKEPGERG